MAQLSTGPSEKVLHTTIDKIYQELNLKCHALGISETAYFLSEYLLSYLKFLYNLQRL